MPKLLCVKKGLPEEKKYQIKIVAFYVFQLQNEKRRLERDLEEIKRQKEEQDDENERLRQEVASLRYVFIIQ